MEEEINNLEEIVKKMDNQIGELGDGVGALLWSLDYAVKKIDCASDKSNEVCVLKVIVKNWLRTSFAQIIMSATEKDNRYWNMSVDEASEYLDTQRLKHNFSMLKYTSARQCK
jgi:hypothetical protein